VSEELNRQARDVTVLLVPRVGSVAVGGTELPWALLDADGSKVDSARAWLIDLHACDYPPATLRSCAYDLLSCHPLPLGPRGARATSYSGLRSGTGCAGSASPRSRSDAVAPEVTQRLGVRLRDRSTPARASSSPRREVQLVNAAVAVSVSSGPGREEHRCEEVVAHRRTGGPVQAAFFRVHRPRPLRRAQPLHPVLPSPDAVPSCELVSEDALPELAGGRRVLWSRGKLRTR